MYVIIVLIPYHQGHHSHAWYQLTIQLLFPLTDLDGKSPSSAEIADLFKQKKEEPSRELMPAHPFSFRSNSVRIQTVIGADGVRLSVLLASCFVWFLFIVGTCRSVVISF